MGESRDANDPRDQLRAMNKEARAEFEGTEASDTGGQEHASRDDRDGRPELREEREQGAGQIARATAEQEDSGKLRAPQGGDVAAGANRNAGGSGERG